MGGRRARTKPCRHAEDWRTTIDGWVRDPAIRHFCLTIVAMLLLSTAFTASLVTGALASVATTVSPTTTGAKVLVASILSTLSGGVWLLKRRRSGR